MKESKKIEGYLIQLMNGDPINNHDVYTSTAISIHKHLTDYGLTSFENPHKPKVKSKPTYSKKSEPKTDILFTNMSKKWKLSIKKDESAYIVSCNSPEDFRFMFIDVFEGRKVLSAEMIQLLEKTASLIGKISNFYSFDKSYKGDVESFVSDKFLPRASSWVGPKKAKEYGNHIINCYNDEVLQNRYITSLNSAESFLQSTITRLFKEYPDYSKKIIFELLTGNIKFGDTDCASNCLADVNGFYILDDYKCQYVTMTYLKFISSTKIGRLQNVPRKVIKKKTLLTGNQDLIAEEFSIADLTFKV